MIMVVRALALRAHAASPATNGSNIVRDTLVCPFSLERFVQSQQV